MVKVLIINYNRLLLPQRMADWLAERDCEPIFIDNASDYLPLLEYYGKMPYKLVKMPVNYGHTVLWQRPDIFEKCRIKEDFIMTDPDLDLSNVPDDFLEVLREGLKVNNIQKCGFSLEITDLPKNEYTEEVIKIESSYWQHFFFLSNRKYFIAGIDTTFALHRWPLPDYNCVNALRTDRPYTAKHVPWYYTSWDELPEDEKYYFQTASNSSSGLKRLTNNLS